MSSQAAPLRDEGTRAQVVTAGAVSGLISRFCIAPLDVLKIRLQVQYHSLADPLSRPTHVRPPGVLQVARDILKHEGITGFWKGNIPAEGLYLSYGAVQFLSYRTASQLLDKLSEDNHFPLSGPAKSFICGATAGTIATTATYPLDLLRTRFAAQGTERIYSGLIASVRDITRHEGAAGFFRGLSAGIGQIVPYMGLFFAFYESLKPQFATIHLPFGSGDAAAGVTASVLAKTAVFPLDTVRKRLQIQGPTRGRYHGSQRMPEYSKGVYGTINMILRREGAIGLYRGLTVSLVKAAPASAATMWTYERAMHVLQSFDERSDS